MVTSFEQMLLDKGYQKYRVVWEGKKGDRTMKYELAPMGASISSLGDIDFRYLKDGENVEFIYGLNEKDKPPTLIYPRPKIMVGKQLWSISHMPDDYMNRAFKQFSNEEIYDAIMYNIVLHITED